jgi:hypothetical protein
MIQAIPDPRLQLGVSILATLLPLWPLRLAEHEENMSLFTLILAAVDREEYKDITRSFSVTGLISIPLLERKQR